MLLTSKVPIIVLVGIRTRVTNNIILDTYNIINYRVIHLRITNMSDYYSGTRLPLHYKTSNIGELIH